MDEVKEAKVKVKTTTSGYLAGFGNFEAGQTLDVTPEQASALKSLGFAEDIAPEKKEETAVEKKGGK